MADEQDVTEEAPEILGTQTSIYLTAEDRRMADELQTDTGLGRSPLFRLALHRMYFGEEKERTKKLLAISEEIKKLA